LPRVNDNFEGALDPLAFVVLFQFLTKPVDLHTHDSVPVLVEVLPSLEDYRGKRVFLDLIGPALEIFVANILK
jgi:hypothetical protein